MGTNGEVEIPQPWEESSDSEVETVSEALYGLINTEPDPERRFYLQQVLASLALTGADEQGLVGVETVWEQLPEADDEYQQETDLEPEYRPPGRESALQWLIGQTQSPRQVMLLRLLAREPGVPLREEDIINAGDPGDWGATPQTQKNALMRTVSLLRQQQPDLNKGLQTERVTLYSLDPAVLDDITERLMEKFTPLTETTKRRLALFIDGDDEAAVFRHLLDNIGKLITASDLAADEILPIRAKDFRERRKAVHRLVHTLQNHPVMGAAIIEEQRAGRREHAYGLDGKLIRERVNKLAALENKWFIDLNEYDKSLLLEKATTQRGKELLWALLHRRGRPTARWQFLDLTTQGLWGESERAVNDSFNNSIRRLVEKDLPGVVMRVGNHDAHQKYQLHTAETRAFVAALRPPIFNKEIDQVLLKMPIAIGRLVGALRQNPNDMITISRAYEIAKKQPDSSMPDVLDFWNRHASELKRLERRGAIRIVRDGNSGRLIGIEAVHQGDITG